MLILYRNRIFVAVAILTMTVLPCFGQSGTDNIRLFQSYFFDTPIATTNHVQPGLVHSSYDNDFSTMFIGANGGYALNPKTEILGKLGYVSNSWKGSSESGLSDLTVVGRYKLSEGKETQFSAGGLITLPIGSKDVGQSNLNFGGFGAVRHPMKNGMVITGNAALLFEEYGDDRESSFEIAGGVIYPKDEKMNIIGELTIKGDKDWMMLSGGVDYLLSGGRARAAIGLGLDNGAPDFQIQAGYLLTL